MEVQDKTVRPHKDYVKRGRPAKRARKPNRPQIETNAQPEALQIPNKPKTIKDQSNAIPRPISRDKLISNKGLDKIRIVRLLLAGASPKDISNKIDIGTTQCHNLIKEIEKDIIGLTWQDYLSLLLGKIRLILDNHTQNSTDIQLAMLDCDIAIEAQHKAIKGQTDKKPKIAQQAQLSRLRSERAGLRAELNANNTSLTGNLSKMGVTNVPLIDKNKVPTQSSIDGNIPLLGELPPSYKDMGRSELLEAMSASNKDVGRYLRAETARKKSESE